MGDKMKNQYDEKYDNEEYYWGKEPSPMCYRVLDILPPTNNLKLLDIGCGEGRNAVFFAKNGYEVSAFDLSAKGVEKTIKYAEIRFLVTIFYHVCNNITSIYKFSYIQK